MLIVITGSYISKLAFAVRYDKPEPEKPTHLEVKWFELNWYQFELISKMLKFLFGNNPIYSVIGDTYFDVTPLFEIYCRYIDSFNNYDNKIGVLHVKDMFSYLVSVTTEKMRIRSTKRAFCKEYDWRLYDRN